MQGNWQNMQTLMLCLTSVVRLRLQSANLLVQSKAVEKCVGDWVGFGMGWFRWEGGGVVHAYNVQN